jgi:LmbE family N-acetylglucosaminyl deacetylase
VYALGLRSGAAGPLKLLCIGAHADDIEIGCGGLVLQLIGEATPVDAYWAVFSGTRARHQEARRSAALFLKGARRSTVSTMAFRDGFFPYEGARIKDRFEKIRREFDPDLVLTHNRDDRHQDHRVLSELTWNTFRDHWVLEYEIPKFDGDLGSPNCFVPLDADTVQHKIEYLETAFASQRDKHWFHEETFRGLMRLRGMECRAAEGYAEAFYSRKLVIHTRSNGESFSAPPKR